MLSLIRSACRLRALDFNRRRVEVKIIHCLSHGSGPSFMVESGIRNFNVKQPPPTTFSEATPTTRQLNPILGDFPPVLRMLAWARKLRRRSSTAVNVETPPGGLRLVPTPRMTIVSSFGQGPLSSTGSMYRTKKNVRVA